jgi:RNA polymerase sigma factor (sigma-70 family)
MSGGDHAGVERRDTGSDRPLSGGPSSGGSVPRECPGPTASPALVEHFFRREYGRLVALLTHKTGLRHIELVEDAVQGALLAALTAWTAQGLPEDPSAWLYRVAHNNLMGELRRRAARLRILERAGDAVAGSGEPPSPPYFADEVADGMLRMLFVCCDDAMPRHSQLVLALKTLCGFSAAEIALRLFTSEANVYKRLARARARLREAPLDDQTPPLETLRSRLPSVQRVLYLLFNEGYLSAHAEQAIRRELCDEAIRLATLLAEHPVGAVPETFALLALMHFHAARLESRLDAMGALLLLEEQDRSRWDRESMRLGAEWLRRSASGEAFSRFHAAAGIAAEHCFAPSFGQTRWSEISDLYAMLERIDPSPLHTMNRAVAVAEWQGPQAGLALLQGLAAPAWLGGSYLWHAVLGDLHRRAGNVELALRHSEQALASAPTDAVRELLRRRLGETAGASGDRTCAPTSATRDR